MTKFLWQRRRREHLPRRVSEIQVTLVRNDVNVTFGTGLNDADHLFFRDHPAGRVVRGVDYDRLCFLSYRFSHLLGAQYEIGFRSVDEYAVGAAEGRYLGEGYPVRFRDQEVVPMVQ